MQKFNAQLIEVNVCDCNSLLMAYGAVAEAARLLIQPIASFLRAESFLPASDSSMFLISSATSFLKVAIARDARR